MTGLYLYKSQTNGKCVSAGFEKYLYLQTDQRQLCITSENSLFIWLKF